MPLTPFKWFKFGPNILGVRVLQKYSVGQDNKKARARVPSGITNPEFL
jgi:hypothetical protein